jgi:N-methylhydantoinase A
VTADGARRRAFRLGVDVGGTFTDLCLFDEHSGDVEVVKTPSTPADQSVGIEVGLRALLAQAGVQPGQLGYLGHGSTVATNAMLEGKLARTGLITTAGFRDLLEIRRQKRPSLYDLFFDKPEPIVPRHLRLEVPERIGADGEIVTPLDEAAARAAVLALVEARVEAIAICFLYSFVNPSHERRVAELAREIAPGLPIWASHEVLPEFREFERLSTTVTNASLGPVVDQYLGNFATRVSDLGFQGHPYIAQSNGGIMSVTAARQRPASMLLSGPSGGVMGAVYVAALADVHNIITLDMGGTSTDVALIEAGTPNVSSDHEIAGYPVRIPMIDINTIGAGGGSIGWIDPGGALKVGPRSAGAVPGPACYRRGGTLPTVSDANVLTRRLNPEQILGGQMAIDAEAARHAIEEHVARPLGMEPIDAALGILTIVDANMVLATRMVSVERGYDPRDFTLVAFGGAGPLHAISIAAELGIRRVLVPEVPGILCALGLLATDMRADYVRTALGLTGQISAAAMTEIWAKLEAGAQDWLADEGIPPEKRLLQRVVDMRYLGQNYELPVPAPGGAWTETARAELEVRFHAAHARTYGYAAPEEATQIVNYRVTAYGLTPHIKVRQHTTRSGSLTAAIVGQRQVYWSRGASSLLTPIYDRARLQPGHEIVGPAIVEQLDATTLIGPGQHARLDEYRNLHIDLAPRPI